MLLLQKRHGKRGFGLGWTTTCLIVSNMFDISTVVVNVGTDRGESCWMDLRDAKLTLGLFLTLQNINKMNR